MRLLIVFCASMLIIVGGCQRHAAPPADTPQVDQRQSERSESSEPASEGFVIVIGDYTATEVLRRLDDNSIRCWTDLTDQAYAKLIIVAQDAAQGLTIHDDILNDLEPNGVKRLLWLMTNCDLIDDQELLELEELEARELLSQHGFAGDVIQFAFDSGPASTEPIDDSPRGWAAITRYIDDLK